MAGWQEELAELLHELGVTQEEPQTRIRSTGKSMRHDARWRLQTRKQLEHLANPHFSDDTGSDEATWSVDLNTMDREVDTIVRQVVHLMHNGELDPSVKEDVVEVLQALRRFSAVAQQIAPGDEAYLESVSAVLRFCRLVLRLSETAIEDL